MFEAMKTLAVLRNNSRESCPGAKRISWVLQSIPRVPRVHFVTHTRGKVADPTSQVCSCHDDVLAVPRAQ
jgi:hypothetical protein